MAGFNTAIPLPALAGHF